MEHRMKLVIAYHGGWFHGWQAQTGQRTVQGEIETALAALFRNRRVAVVGAGRTDAGVHAAGQVAHLDPPGPIPSDALVRGLNSRLPPDIRVRSARNVATDFHARKSALGKLYTYRARWEAELPWLQPRSATVEPVTDWKGLEAALGVFAGRHDWASFTVPEAARGSTVRTLHGARLCRRRDGVDLEFVGDGFLRYQIRRMVGVLLEVGTGERAAHDLRWLIDHPQPGASIRTAPAHGLCLEHVYYRSCPAIARSPASRPGGAAQ